MHTCTYTERGSYAFFTKSLTSSNYQLIDWHEKLYFYLSCEFSPLSVTRNYFENLVRALETGLKDVGSGNNQATCSKSTSSKSLGKGKSGKMKAAGTSSRSGGGPSRGSEDNNMWSCDHCTYANPRSSSVCQMCEQHR